MNVVEVLVWWLVVGYVPTAGGAALAVAALSRPPRGRHSARRAMPRVRVRRAPRARHATREDAPPYLPEVLSEVEHVIENRARIDARARGAEWDGSDELRAARAWLDKLHEPVPVELARYEHAAGSPAYLDVTAGARARTLPRRDGGVPRDVLEARVSTAEMFLRFGDALVPELEPAEVT